MGKVLQGPWGQAKSLTPVTTGVKDLVPVESEVEMLVARDQWQRPLIIPPDGGDPVAYRRASTVAEALESHFGLHQWKTRVTAQGFAMRPDLLQAVHTASKKELGELCEQAFIAAGGEAAARNGSTVHALIDRLNRGEDVPPGLPSNIVAMLEEYEKAMERFTWLDGEQFVVQDKIKVAGTYDGRYRDDQTGMVVIGDVKTSQSLEYHAVKTPAQVAVYASGVKYDLDGNREEHGADRDRGLFIWLPWTEDPKQALCELRWLDLRVGRQAILEAMRIDKFRKIKASQTLLHVK